MEKETIADLCERLRKTNDKGYFYCDQLAKNWDFRCGDMEDCGECRKILSTSIADRIEAAYQREVDELRADNGDMWLKGYAECHQELLEGDEVIADDLRKCGWSKSDLANLGKPCVDGDAVLDASTIRSTDRRREVLDRLRAYREHPPVRDVGGLIVEDTYSVGEVEGIITGKELFTTGDFIDALIGLIGGDECKKPTPETYSGLTLRFPNPAETSDGGDASVTSDARSDASEAVKKLREFALGEVANHMGPNDAEELLSIARRIEASKVMEKIDEERRARADEDTREKLEEDIKNTQWCVSLKDIFGWLDRQAAITERNCRAEYDDMRDYLQAQVDRLTDENEVMRQALMDLGDILG